jgi:hypothetical protein
MVMQSSGLDLETVRDARERKIHKALVPSKLERMVND